MAVAVYKRGDHNSWRAEWKDLTTGKRRTKNFPTEKEARKHALKLEEEASRYGMMLAVSDEERMFMARVRGILNDNNMTLNDAEAAIRRHAGQARSDDGTPITVSKAISAFYRDCAQRKLRPDTITSYQKMLDKYCDKAGGNTLSSVEPDSVMRHIFGRFENDQSRLACKRTLCAWLNWCASQGWCSPEVAKGVTWRAARKDERTIAILTPAEAAALIRAIPDKHAHIVALALFAGIRPSGELQRLQWDHVRFDPRVNENPDKPPASAWADYRATMSDEEVFHLVYHGWPEAIADFYGAIKAGLTPQDAKDRLENAFTLTRTEKEIVSRAFDYAYRNTPGVSTSKPRTFGRGKSGSKSPKR